MENCIIVKKENNQMYLMYKSLKVEAAIGKNGLTNNLVEGDMKTPIGEFDLGMWIYVKFLDTFFESFFICMKLLSLPYYILNLHWHKWYTELLTSPFTPI